MWGIAQAAKFWETEPEISAPVINAPSADRVVGPGTHVTCTGAGGTDQDKWTEGGETGYDTDDMNRVEKPEWWSEEPNWEDDIFIGTQVTWIAPDYPGNYGLQMCDNDEPKELDEDDSGDRDDQAAYAQEQTIGVADVTEGVTLHPFQGPWQGGTRSSDAKETGDQMMIYPGWKTVDYNDTTDGNPNTNPWPYCNLLRVRADLSHNVPAGSSVDVYFRIFDVDDPKWGGKDKRDSVDDDTVTMYNDNYPKDNMGAVLKEDTADTQGGTLIKVTLVGDGRDTLDALAEITQPYPGNNWRFVASTRQEWLEGVYIDNSDGMTLKDAGGTPVPQCKRTPPLTCWRYLHVEVDSMGRPEDNQPQGGAHIFGSVEGESDALTNTMLLDAEAEFTPRDQLIGAAVDPDKGDTYDDAYAVTQGGECSVICNGATMLDHADTGDAYSIDTDDVYPGDLDAPDTGLLAQAFAPACISVVYDTARDSGDVLFLRDDIDQSQRGTLQENDKYWSTYIMSAYEFSRERDNDPDSESEPWLGTYDLAPNGNEWCFIFMETLRDSCEDCGWEAQQQYVEQITVCHEVGHDFLPPDYGVDGHCTTPGCLMESGISPNSGCSFCASCVAAIRRTTRP